LPADPTIKAGEELAHYFKFGSIKKKLDAFNAGFTGVVKNLDTARANGQQHALDEPHPGARHIADLRPTFELGI
jgi:hypothetical protein